MARGCDHAVHVHIDVKPAKRGRGQKPRTGRRHFIVEYDADGEVIRVKERRLYAPGEPWQKLYDAPYWKAGTHALGTKDTVIKQAIAAAAAKSAAEDRNADATP